MPHPSQAKYRNLIVIGCGPHYRNRYHAVLEAEKVTISLLIDLQAQKETILSFFQDKELKPAQTLFLDEAYRNSITPDQIETLVAKLNLTHVDAVLLCTEPKVRKPYALWAFQHKFPVFMDKPPCAFPHAEKKSDLLLDFEEIVRSAEKTEVDVVVSCERRAHFGYLWLMDYLHSFIQEEETPPTSINIHFANGHWVTPFEYHEQEHHPFKYGYGLLLHSGYHYIDLLSSFLSLHQTKEIQYDLKVISTHPQDALKSASLLSPSPFGETSVLFIGQAKNRGKLLSNFSVQLENTSLSKRTSPAPSQEAKWRMRQEHVIIHLGYLASIHISCNPLTKLDPDHYPVEDFNIVIMHSPLLKERQPIIKMTRDDIAALIPHRSLNQYAREWQLKEFLHGRDGNSSLKSHENTMKLLHLIYSQIGDATGLHQSPEVERSYS
jgi:predicted dehydrogenase